jgi:hypothetical protein
LVWFTAEAPLSEPINQDNSQNQKELKLTFGDNEKTQTLSYINERINKKIAEQTPDL